MPFDVPVPSAPRPPRPSRPAPPPHRDFIRFALPPSLGKEETRRFADQLGVHLTRSLKRQVQVVTPETYDALAKELLSGRSDAAWAPPFVCARIEAMGVRVLVRGVRAGQSSYRAALVTRAGGPTSVGELKGKRAVWTDPDSIGGYLLPLAHLRTNGLDVKKYFASQTFAGSYQDALFAVANGTADVTSVFAPLKKTGLEDETGLSALVPGRENEFQVVAYTEHAPNDGVAVSMNAPDPLVVELEKTLLDLHTDTEGTAILKDTFNAERFELAPRMGYRALYRVALAGL